MRDKRLTARLSPGTLIDVKACAGRYTCCPSIKNIHTRTKSSILGSFPGSGPSQQRTVPLSYVPRTRGRNRLDSAGNLGQLDWQKTQDLRGRSKWQRLLLGSPTRETSGEGRFPPSKYRSLVASRRSTRKTKRQKERLESPVSNNVL